MRRDRDREAGDSVDLHLALKSPVRRRILELLYEYGELSPSELRRLLNVSVGTLYYHLENLAPLISQTEGRKYTLSELGRKVIVSEGLDAVVVPREKPLRQVVVERWSLLPLFSRLYEAPMASLALATLSAVLYVVLNVFNGVRPLVFYFLPSSGNALLDILWSVGNFIFIVVYFVVAFVLLSPQGRRGYGLGRLAAIVTTSFIPTLLLLSYSLLVLYRMLPNDQYIFTLVYTFLAVWQVLVYGGALYSVGLSFSKSLLPPLALWYIAEVAEKLLGMDIMF